MCSEFLSTVFAFPASGDTKIHNQSFAIWKCALETTLQACLCASQVDHSDWRTYILGGNTLAENDNGEMFKLVEAIESTSPLLCVLVTPLVTS